MTVFSTNIHHHGLFPPEHEVPAGGAQSHGQAEPDVVRHEDQHEAVRQYDLKFRTVRMFLNTVVGLVFWAVLNEILTSSSHLYKLKYCLQEVTPGEDAGLDDLHLLPPGPPRLGRPGDRLLGGVDGSRVCNLV